MTIDQIKDKIYFHYFKNILATSQMDEMTLAEMLTFMQDNSLKTETMRFRAFVNQLDLTKDADKATYTNEKVQKFGAFTPAGLFNENRETANLIYYSYIVHMDFDHITVAQKDELLNYLKKKDDAFNKSVVFAFTSPSNEGLKIFHLVNGPSEFESVEETQAFHTEAFFKIAQHYTSFGFLNSKEIDSKIHDLARCCFVCYDANLYINNEIEILKFDTDIVAEIRKKNVDQAIVEDLLVKWTSNVKELTIKTEDIVAKLDQLVNWLTTKKKSITSTYANWLTVIFALKKDLPANLAYKYALIFSKMDASFNQNDFDKKFHQKKYNVKKSPSINSIFYIASEIGFKMKRNEFSDDFMFANELRYFFTKLAENKIWTRYNMMYCNLEIHDFAKQEWCRFQDDLHLLPITFSVLQLPAKQKNEVYEKLKVYSLMNYKFDPVAEFKNSLPEWDKVDRFDLVVNALNLSNEEDIKWAQLFFRLWFVGFWAGLLTDSYNENMIILQGLGGLGKTRFVKRLFSVFKECGLNMNDYFTVKNIDAGNKDHLLEMTSKFVILNDELETLTNKKDNLDALKAMMSADNFSLRQIYKINNTSFKRYASMIGTINNQNFLKDPTGNRRFWVLPVANKIDQNFEIDLKQFFAQSLYMFKNGERHYLSDVEKRELDKYQVRFETPSMEEELILRHVVPDDNTELSATEVYMEVTKMSQFVPGKSVQFFGKLLHKHFADRYFTKPPGQLPRRGYKVRVVPMVKALTEGGVYSEAYVHNVDTRELPPEMTITIRDAETLEARLLQGNDL